MVTYHMNWGFPNHPVIDPMAEARGLYKNTVASSGLMQESELSLPW